ncbi:MAG: hypothetical protein GC160_22290 [Acidobacteria bacterium]|nr:hypothetical protein [Acidobacteriota bacterium]
MSYSHASSEPIAEAEAWPVGAEEEDDLREPRLLQLYLDSDARYRWYEEDEASEFASRNLLEAIEAAEDAWDGFQLVEFRGTAVDPATTIPDAYAVDELETLDES